MEGRHMPASLYRWATDVVVDVDIVLKVRDVVGCFVARGASGNGLDQPAVHTCIEGRLLRDGRPSWVSGYSPTPWKGHGTTCCVLSCNVRAENGQRQSTQQRHGRRHDWYKERTKEDTERTQTDGV